MTDNAELKRLAENHLSLGQAYTVAKPSVLLALISENERLSADEEEASAVVDRLAELLAGVSLAVRGPYLPLQRHSYHDLPERCASLVAERDQLKAENEALRKNAERYQWLREARGGYIEVVEWIGPHATGMTGEDLDALLDAATGKGEQS